MKKQLIYLLFALVTLNVSAQIKREFRGAWIQCVNGQFLGMGNCKKMVSMLLSFKYVQSVMPSMLHHTNLGAVS